MHDQQSAEDRPQTNHSGGTTAAAFEASDERDLGAFIPRQLDDYGLDPYEFRVYSRVVRRAGGPRGCDESSANIAKAIGCQPKRVQEALALLTAAGLLRKESRPGKPSKYTLRPASEWAPVEQLPELRQSSRRKQYPALRPVDDQPEPDDAPESSGPESDGPHGPEDPATEVLRTAPHGPEDPAPESSGPTKVLPEGSPGRGKGSASPRSAVASHGHLEVTLSMPDGRTLEVDVADGQASFETWWQAYPRHPGTNARGGGGGRKVSRQRWLKLSLPKRAAAIAAIGNYHAHLAVTGYPPVYAEKWLAQERWQDYAEPPAAGADGLDDLELGLAGASKIDPDQLTGEGRRDLVASAAAIRRVGATVELVDQVAKKFRDTWPDIQPTPTAIAKNWARFVPAITGRRSGPVCASCGQPRDGHDIELCRILGRTA